MKLTELLLHLIPFTLFLLLATLKLDLTKLPKLTQVLASNLNSSLHSRNHMQIQPQLFIIDSLLFSLAFCNALLDDVQTIRWGIDLISDELEERLDIHFVLEFVHFYGSTELVLFVTHTDDIIAEIA